MRDVRCPDCGSLWFRLVDDHTVQVKCRQANRKGVKPHSNRSGLYRVKLGMAQPNTPTPVRLELAEMPDAREAPAPLPPAAESAPA